MPDNRKPLIYGAFPVCRNYTVRAHQRQLADSGPCACYNGFGQTGPRKDQYHHGHLRRVHPFQRCGGSGRADGRFQPNQGKVTRITKDGPQGRFCRPREPSTFLLSSWCPFYGIVCPLESALKVPCFTETKRNEDAQT